MQRSGSGCVWTWEWALPTRRSQQPLPTSEVQACGQTQASAMSQERGLAGVRRGKGSTDGVTAVGLPGSECGRSGTRLRLDPLSASRLPPVRYGQPRLCSLRFVSLCVVGLRFA